MVVGQQWEGRGCWQWERGIYFLFALLEWLSGKGNGCQLVTVVHAFSVFAFQLKGIESSWRAAILFCLNEQHVYRRIAPYSAFAVIPAVGDACGSVLVAQYLWNFGFWLINQPAHWPTGPKNAFLHRVVQLKVHFVLFRAGIAKLWPDPIIRRWLPSPSTLRNESP